MKGVANSWIEHVYAQPTPCMNGNGSSILSNCIIWLIAGLVVGSITFKKKGTQK